MLLRGATLLDGRRWEPQSDRDVVIEGGRITAVGKGCSAAQTVLDCRGLTVMPGLIDCHVHLSVTGGPDFLREARDPLAFVAWRAAKHARDTLQAGFTTVRSLGDRDYVTVHLREAVAEGLVEGPRIVTAGLPICMTGGHGWLFGSREADGADGVRQAVREQLKAGADVIKLIATGGVLTPGVQPGAPQLTRAELEAGVEEAHKAGRRAAAHAQGAEGIRNAVLAGIDSIEHGFYLEEDTASLMATRGTYLVPTFSALRNILAHGTSAGLAEYVVQKAATVSTAQVESFQRALAAGVRVALGTDAGTPFNYHGANAQELGHMVEAGLPVARALAAATSEAATLLGLDHEIGTIDVGKAADLIVVDGDPLADVRILADQARIVAVIARGRLLRCTHPARVTGLSGRSV
ncbi:MAG: amidohydrolase family protein [Chloroflexi bacterium]|nr:amidohydrolase family protein [Chloroflexota bacterium]